MGGWVGGCAWSRASICRQCPLATHTLISIATLGAESLRTHIYMKAYIYEDTYIVDAVIPAWEHTH